jgi:hypothetical protein
VLLPSTAWCIPHLGVSCVDHNNNKIGAIANNSIHGNSSSNSCSSNSNSSTVPLLHRRSRLPSGHHSSFLPATFHASTVGRWRTMFENAAYQSTATRLELRHPWSISRGAIRRVIHHGRVTPTTPWRRFPRVKKCQWVCSSSMNIPSLFYSIMERRMIL